MKVTKHEDVATFLQKVLPILETREDVNSLMIGLLLPISKSVGPNPPLLIAVEQDGLPIYAVIQTPPHNLILAGVDDDLSLVLHDLVRFLIAKSIHLPGVIGPKEAVQKFVRLWCEMKGCQSILKMNQMVYRLEKVLPVRFSSGYLRPAEPKDSRKTEKMLFDFSKEINIPVTMSEVNRIATQKINDQSIWVWVDNSEIVSLAASSRPTPNGITVNYVFTPKEYRKRGFASSCVAQLSQKLLEKGYSFCTLFTDLDYPTSNRIYQNIGYVPICSFQQHHFIY